MEYNIGDSSVKLARTIGKIHTYIDLMETIAKYQKNQNSFWELVFYSLEDLVVIESYKLIDKKNLSVFSLIKQVKGIRPSDKDELDKDYKELKKLISTPEFHLVQHRHTQKAHLAQKINGTLPRFADFTKIIELLDLCENLLKKYNKWINGPNNFVEFRSIYAGGHKRILDYVADVLSTA